MTGEPLLADVLRAIAETTPLATAASRLGLSGEQLRAFLLKQAGGPAPSSIPLAPTAYPERREDALRSHHEPFDTLPLVAAQGERVDQIGHAIVEIFSDGAARGNPGPAGAGAVVRSKDGRILARLGKFLGVQTNNVAEYEGLLLGLRKAAEMGAREVHVFADSLLVISQLRGEWKIKHPGLRPLFDDARKLIAKFDRVTLAHVPREKNGEADEMSNRAIDERM